jgi:single-stranded-DNA-specific exonuclease
MCATALYTRWLRSLDVRAVPFVPHRLRDGYDFGDAGLAAARDAGATLVLTADCGTSAHETVRRARAEGLDVIVTDHHAVGAALPPASAVVNPQRSDCAYPDKGLCGTGVAFKLCALVGRALGAREDDLLVYLDLVALATVADLVPLEGENRVLVRHGLRRFADTRLPGMGALLEAAGVSAADVSAGRLGYVVAPRLNAAGRVGDAMDGLRLLLTDDVGEARELAAGLEELNRARREEDRRTLGEALDALGRTWDPERDYGVVLAGEGWHPGVIGIVASRVVERVYRPTVLLALEGDRARGSARSIPGFDLYEAVAACAPHLRRFGGHRQAAGMDVDRDAIPAFREAFNVEARRHLVGRELRPTLHVDAELSLADADLQLVHWLSYLGPHGIGNPRPVFLARGVGLFRPRVVGESHLKVALRGDGVVVDAIGFDLARRHPPERLTEEARYDVLFRLGRNEWRGAVTVQAELLDLRASEPEVA